VALSANNSALLNLADPSSIKAVFIDVWGNWCQTQWLLSSNRYQGDCIKRIKKDVGRNRQITHRHLREYIAASSVAHCADGWGYLGRSIEAHLRGDGNVSRHLGYYAELRAALGLLASEGIGVFDRNHFVVDRQKSATTSKRPAGHMSLHGML
jgi:hypothetical protein